jgi:AdoMet-dependent rRNA methyltransferase SPB1
LKKRVGCLPFTTHPPLTHRPHACRYRSRAAFKLIQLNRKYDFLSGARRILDLCAAPGGWLQVAVKTMPVGSLILGVDLVAIKPIHGCKTFIGDITTQKCRAQVLKETGGALMDVVLHDGAPNVGGAWASEAYGQAWLTLEALKLATDVLTPKGIFVTKVFRSSDYTALLYALNQLFTKVESTKPAASRSASAEIFVVCRGYKAPSKIDPRLLDPKHLFKQVEEMPKAAGPDALLKTKVTQRRFREGYEEGISTTHKPISAAAFVVGDSPIEALGQHTGIDLAGAASEGEFFCLGFRPTCCRDVVSS